MHRAASGSRTEPPAGLPSSCLPHVEDTTMTQCHRKLFRSLLLTAVTLLPLAALPALAGDHDGDRRARGCARQFELAQRMDMESFRDYDAETFRAVHDERAVTVFASGAVRTGID